MLRIIFSYGVKRIDHLNGCYVLPLAIVQRRTYLKKASSTLCHLIFWNVGNSGMQSMANVERMPRMSCITKSVVCPRVNCPHTSGGSPLSAHFTVELYTLAWAIISTRQLHGQFLRPQNIDE